MRRASLTAASAATLLFLLGLAGCGEDPVAEQPDAERVDPQAELGARRGTIESPRGEQLLRMPISLAPDARALIVAHVQFADPASARAADLTLAFDGEPAKAEQAIIGADRASRIIACLCQSPGARYAALELTAGGKIRIEGSSLIAVDGVESAADDGAGSAADAGADLPDPLLAAEVATEPGAITPSPTPLVSAELVGLDPGTPLLVVGAVRPARSATNLDAIQIEARAGDDFLSSIGSRARPGSFTGLYAGEAGETESLIHLQGATAGGRAPIAAGLLFACACTT